MYLYELVVLKDGHLDLLFQPITVSLWLAITIFIFSISKCTLCTFFFSLKTLDTIGNCQRPLSSLGVSQHMHIITNLWQFELNRSSKLRDNNERKITPCHTKLCAFRCLISRPQILNLRSNSRKITSFSKTKSLQRKPFLTMFYTVNLSPLLVTM